MLELKVSKTPIPGVLVLDLPVYKDNRGWFKENWQNQKMSSLGLPEFEPVQNNISFNAEVGVTRGFHAEPWDKYISVASGKVFGAWIDLRDGKTFGKVFTTELTPEKAIFIPRGIANSFQVLEPNTAYSYLVNDHWSEDKQEHYSFVNLADPSVDVNWPIPLEKAILSEKDKTHPLLKDVAPIKNKKILVTGSDGQLGKALQEKYPDSIFTDYKELDITNIESLEKFDWSNVSTVINAAAFTNVDGAETEEGRVATWRINAVGVKNLAKIANEHRLTLVHISSDYVFDGSRSNHQETENFSPLGVYGQSKAAGDIACELAKKHYILRASWVIGDGNNFVKTMIGLGKKGISPSVVSDQLGRLTFTKELVRAIDFLLVNSAPFGTYNLSNDGPVKSWAEITEDIFKLCEFDDLSVNKVSTEDYYKDKELISPRPKNSDLNLDKIHQLGFKSIDWESELKDYVKKEIS